MKSGRKLKVGLVFDDSLDTNDGVAQYVKNLGSWLGRQGHEVRYLVGQTGMTHFDGSKVYSLSRNLSVSFNGNRLTIPLFARKHAIKNVLKKENFDVLHVMVPFSPFMAQKIIKMAAFDTAIIGTFHIYPSGILTVYASKLLRILSGRSLRRFFMIVSVSHPAAAFAKKAFGLKTPVIPNPVNIDKLKPKTINFNQNSPQKIVFLGRLVNRKGCRELIKAFSVVISDFPEVRLVIAGDGPERTRLESLVAKLNLLSSVDFLGYIEEDTKPKLLSEATIACFPALHGESFGLVLIEAMAAGSQVVIGGNNPGYSFVLSDRPELLINPVDKLAFADRLKTFLNDSKLRGQVHEWQQNEVKKYDIENVGSAVLGLYSTAIASIDKNGHNKKHE